MIQDYQSGAITEAYDNQLKQLLAAVKARVTAGAKVSVTAFFMSDTPRSEMKAYLSFTPHGDELNRVLTDPGIPLHALWKTGTLADWIAKQISAKRPEWLASAQ